MTGFGTVQYGTFATAYMDSGRKLDPFYATAAAGIGQPTATVAGGQSHGLSFLTSDGAAQIIGGGFVSNQLAYTSPSFAGLTGNVAVMFDDGAGPNEQDDYAVGVEFSNWGITAGAQYLEANNSTNIGLAEDEEAVRLYGGFSQRRFGVAVSGERIDLVGGANDADFLMLSGWFGVLPGTRVAASASMENETGAEGTSFRVGVFHDVLDNFTTHVVYRNYNNTDATTPDDQVISLGASFKFELSGMTSR
jgi:predicted porin